MGLWLLKQDCLYNVKAEMDTQVPNASIYRVQPDSLDQVGNKAPQSTRKQYIM